MPENTQGADVQVEPLGDHEYVVRVHQGAEVAVTRMQASRAVLDELGIPDSEEARAVAETAVYLAERQSVADLPQLVDLEDVAAGYADYVPELGRRLSGG